MDRGRARTNLLETIKTTLLQGLDADRGSMIEVVIDGEPTEVYPIHYESDLSAVYSPSTPRPFRVSELKLTDAQGDEIQDLTAMLNLPMRATGVRARPNILNAAGISPYALEDSGSVNCAVYQLSRHLEMPEEQVSAELVNGTVHAATIFQCVGRDARGIEDIGSCSYSRCAHWEIKHCSLVLDLIALVIRKLQL